VLSMRFNTYLARQGLTPAGFARRAKIPRSTILDLVAGKSKLRASTAYKIIKATRGEVSLEELVRPPRKRNKPEKQEQAVEQ